MIPIRNYRGRISFSSEDLVPEKGAFVTALKKEQRGLRYDLLINGPMWCFRKQQTWFGKVLNWLGVPKQFKRRWRYRLVPRQKPWKSWPSL